MKTDLPLAVWALTGARTRGSVPPRPVPTSPEDGLFRAWVAPGLLLLATPPLALLAWIVVTHDDGSLLTFARRWDAARVWALAPRPSWWAAATVAAWAAAQGALLWLLPGERTTGPVTPAGERPSYRLNGVAAFVVTHLGLAAAWRLGWLSARTFHERYGELLATLVVSALAFCAFLYWKGRRYPSSRDAVLTGRPLFDFFQGVELHPTLFGLGLKQLVNCRVSMMGWSATTLLFAFAQIERRGRLSPALAVCVALHLVYLLKFFHWERGYFHSLDIMHDRFGYYICWGVLAWVPAVYALAPLFLVEHAPELSAGAALAIGALGVAAIGTNYLADRQRRLVRDSDGRAKIWGRAPVVLRAPYTTSDGEKHENLLLCSGFWGISRHFHYLPELTAAFLWTLPVGFGQLLPWLYPVFLLVLLVDRAGRDDARCAKKYGAAWDEYRARVPSRLVPFVY